jgi:hypothetical protein
MDGFFKLLNNFIEGLDLPRRWVVGTVIIGFVIFCIWVYEVNTGRFYYDSLERKIGLLGQLNELATAGIEDNPELYPVYQEAIDELSTRKVYPYLFQLTSPVDPVTFWKGLSGAIFWLLMALGTLAFAKTNKLSTALVLTIFGIMAGIIGVFIPTAENPLFNYLGFPLTQFLLILLIGSIGARRQKARSIGTNMPTA